MKHHPTPTLNPSPQGGGKLALGVVISTCWQAFGGGSAVAEVCDKMAGESWTQSSGPWGLFGNELIFTLVSIGIVVSPLIFNRGKWVIVLVASLLIALSMLRFSVRSEDPDLWNFAIYEGCASRALIVFNDGLPLAIGLVLMFLAFRRRSFSKAT